MVRPYAEEYARICYDYCNLSIQTLAKSLTSIFGYIFVCIHLYNGFKGIEVDEEGKHRSARFLGIWW